MGIIQTALTYIVFSAIGAFVWAPLLIKLLYKYKITRLLEGENKDR